MGQSNFNVSRLVQTYPDLVYTQTQISEGFAGQQRSQDLRCQATPDKLTPFFLTYRYIRYTFSSNHNIHKSLCGLCFWASVLSKIYQSKGLKPQNKGHTNFYECCDLTKKVYLMYVLYVPCLC